jgi:hypothetical protein
MDAPRYQGVLLEFGSGIAGYAIFYHPDKTRPSRRRYLLNQIPTKGDFRTEVFDPETWVPEKDQPVEGDRMGKGKVITPGPKLSYTKIGDMVPTWIPNRALRPVPKRQPKKMSWGPRRSSFNYGVSGFASL